MKHKILCSLVLGTFVFCACSSNDSTGGTDRTLEKYSDSNASLWRSLAEKGVSEFFEEAAAEGKFVIGEPSPAPAKSRCADSALKMDNYTRYMDELESIFEEGTLVEGVCGQALSLKAGEVAPLGVNLIDSIKVGTVEFWFRPGEDFYDEPSRTLLGNDESRLHFFYKDGALVFQKNHADIHYFAMGKAELRDGWNLIAGQWGDGYLSVWLNGKLVDKIKHDEGYAPSLRDKPFGNLLVIGYKSYCCMEGPGQYEGMTTSGSFDQFRISSIPRYNIENAVEQNSFAGDTIWILDTLRCCYDSVEVNPVVSDTNLSLWETLNRGGLGYFSKQDLPEVSPFQPGRCSAPALAMDENTLYFDELETIFREGELVDGICGKAISLKDGEVAPLGINLTDSITAGTVEFWFHPGSDFAEKPVRTILGNDGSRIQFLYQDGQLIFQKNHHNIHYFVKGEVVLDTGWNLIAGQWGDGYLSIWLNGEKVASVEHAEGYVPANRGMPFENLVMIGYKSYCCMEGPGVSGPLTASGAYDQLRISNIPRYELEEYPAQDSVPEMVEPEL